MEMSYAVSRVRSASRLLPMGSTGAFRVPAPWMMNIKVLKNPERVAKVLNSLRSSNSRVNGINSTPNILIIKNMIKGP